MPDLEDLGCFVIGGIVLVVLLLLAACVIILLLAVGVFGAEEAVFDAPFDHLALARHLAAGFAT